MYNGLQEFLEVKETITDAFENIDSSLGCSLTYSEQAMQISEKRVQIISQLKEFAGRMENLASESNDKVSAFGE